MTYSLTYDLTFLRSSAVDCPATTDIRVRAGHQGYVYIYNLYIYKYIYIYIRL